VGGGNELAGWASQEKGTQNCKAVENQKGGYTQEDRQKTGSGEIVKPGKRQVEDFYLGGGKKRPHPVWFDLKNKQGGKGCAGRAESSSGLKGKNE